MGNIGFDDEQFFRASLQLCSLDADNDNWREFMLNENPKQPLLKDFKLKAQDKIVFKILEDENTSYSAAYLKQISGKQYNNYKKLLINLELIEDEHFGNNQKPNFNNYFYQLIDTLDSGYNDQNQNINRMCGFGNNKKPNKSIKKPLFLALLSKSAELASQDKQTVLVTLAEHYENKWKTHSNKPKYLFLATQCWQKAYDHAEANQLNFNDSAERIKENYGILFASDSKYKAKARSWLMQHENVAPNSPLFPLIHQVHVSFDKIELRGMYIKLLRELTGRTKNYTGSRRGRAEEFQACVELLANKYEGKNQKITDALLNLWKRPDNIQSIAAVVNELLKDIENDIKVKDFARKLLVLIEYIFENSKTPKNLKEHQAYFFAKNALIDLTDEEGQASLEYQKRKIYVFCNNSENTELNELDEKNIPDILREGGPIQFQSTYTMKKIKEAKEIQEIVNGQLKLKEKDSLRFFTLDCWLETVIKQNNVPYILAEAYYWRAMLHLIGGNGLKQNVAKALFYFEEGVLQIKNFPNTGIYQQYHKRYHDLCKKIYILDEDELLYLPRFKDSFPESIVTGILPNSKEEVNFTKQDVEHDGDCGFHALDTNRKEVTKTLVKLADNEEDRKKLAPEIYDAFRSCELNFPLDKKEGWEKLSEDYGLKLHVLNKAAIKIARQIDPNLYADFEGYMSCISSSDKNDLKEKINKIKLNSENAKDALINFCATKDIFEYYVNKYATSGLWLGCTSALLYEKQMRNTVYIWRQEEKSNKLVLIDHHKEEEGEVIHILLTNRFTHFNILKPSPKKEVVNEEEVNSEEIIIGEALNNFIEDTKDFLEQKELDKLKTHVDLCYQNNSLGKQEASVLYSQNDRLDAPTLQNLINIRRRQEKIITKGYLNLEEFESPLASFLNEELTWFGNLSFCQDLSLDKHTEIINDKFAEDNNDKDNLDIIEMSIYGALQTRLEEVIHLDKHHGLNKNNKTSALIARQEKEISEIKKEFISCVPNQQPTAIYAKKLLEIIFKLIAVDRLQRQELEDFKLIQAATMEDNRQKLELIQDNKKLNKNNDLVIELKSNISETSSLLGSDNSHSYQSFQNIGDTAWNKALWIKRFQTFNEQENGASKKHIKITYESRTEVNGMKVHGTAKKVSESEIKNRKLPDEPAKIGWFLANQLFWRETSYLKHLFTIGISTIGSMATGFVSRYLQKGVPESPSMKTLYDVATLNIQQIYNIIVDTTNNPGLAQQVAQVIGESTNGINNNTVTLGIGQSNILGNLDLHALILKYWQDLVPILGAVAIIGILYTLAHRYVNPQHTDSIVSSDDTIIDEKTGLLTHAELLGHNFHFKDSSNEEIQETENKYKRMGLLSFFDSSSKRQSKEDIQQSSNLLDESNESDKKNSPPKGQMKKDIGGFKSCSGALASNYNQAFFKTVVNKSLLLKAAENLADAISGLVKATDNSLN